MCDERDWAQRFRNFLKEQGEGDPAHELAHVQRVVRNARSLCEEEGADWSTVMPAAWLHDCVFVAKDSPRRSEASRLSADQALLRMREWGYPAKDWDAIHHAIVAHSFSAQVAPRTLEARVLQDADRIDALGAVGLSRCLMLGGHLGTELMSPEDPFCEQRTPDDSQFTIDHFYRKLLRLEETMQTSAGRQLARERTQVLHDFLQQLRLETDG